MKIDQSKTEEFVGQVVTDMAAAMSGVMVNLGHKLGLYEAMAGAGPVTAEELARTTGTQPRYVKEWLNNQVAGGYIVHDPGKDTYEMPDEHAPVLADPDSPVFLAPGFDVISSLWLDEKQVEDAFRTGRGVGWHEHHKNLFFGTEAFFRPGYRDKLVDDWIASLDGVKSKLESGGRVADVGCGHGASTIIMAEAFPKSTFVGFDYHPESIDVARERAQQAGLTDRIRFETASATEFDGGDYDLICFMDCFHDLGDPVGAARHAGRALSDQGCMLLVEPHAGDKVEDNVGPVGRMFYAASTALCVPNSLSQDVGLGLGAQAGESRIADVLSEAGFGTVRRAAETPFNMVIEARP